MSNPFKVGDWVVSMCSGTDIQEGGLYKVTAVEGDIISFLDDVGYTRHRHYIEYDAAIYGQNCPRADKPIQANTGHMPDGSGIQLHSAGGHYPYVLVYRDKKQYCDEFGRYDVGVIGPQNQTPLWFKSLNHAVRVIETMKGNEA